MSPFELPTTSVATIHVDGSCPRNPGPMGIGYVVETEGAGVLIRVGAQIGSGTNNQAEYRALIEALRHALRYGMYNVVAWSDSELMVNQIKGKWKVRDRKSLGFLYDEAIALAALFRSFEIYHTPRERNAAADDLSRKLAMEQPPLPPLRSKKGKRALRDFQAAALRVWYTMGEQSVYRLSRIMKVDDSTVEQVVMNRSYKDASFEENPQWDSPMDAAAVGMYVKRFNELFTEDVEKAIEEELREPTWISRKQPWDSAGWHPDDGPGHG